MRNHEAWAVKNKATFVFTCIDAPSTLATQTTQSGQVMATGTATKKKPLQKVLKYLLTQPCEFTQHVNSIQIITNTHPVSI